MSSKAPVSQTRGLVDDDYVRNKKELWVLILTDPSTNLIHSSGTLLRGIEEPIRPCSRVYNLSRGIFQCPLSNRAFISSLIGLQLGRNLGIDGVIRVRVFKQPNETREEKLSKG
jgi:hypothetical protein